MFYMQRKTHVEQLRTDAPLDVLEQVLLELKWKVQRTKYSLTAQHGSALGTNGRIGRIQIEDDGMVRWCYNEEESVGAFCNPKSGRLAKIIALAEEKTNKISK